MVDLESKRFLLVPLETLFDLGNTSNSGPRHGPVAMNLICLQTSVMQELYASFEDGARPVGEFFTALKALRCTWPTGGKLMIQVKAGEPERTRTWFSHQLVRPLCPMLGLLITFNTPRRSKVNHWIYLLSYTQGVSRCSSCNLLICQTMSSFYSFRNRALRSLVRRRMWVGLGVEEVLRNRNPR